MVNFALRGDYNILDRFIDLKQPKYLYHCKPRGLAVHWLAGNVPLLGLYSLFQTLLTKNVSLVKASKRAYKEFLILVDSLNQVNTEKIKGSELLKTIAIVLIGRDEKETQKTISEAADIRIAWGGHDAIKAITGLPKTIFCEDIVFGPKYSYGVIDKFALPNYKSLTQRIAFDICTFDQYACSSPHTLFIEETDEIKAETVAAELAKNLAFVSSKMIPKEDNNPQKKMDILSLRAKYSMVGKIFASVDTDWTVICSTEEGLADACFSRVIHVKPISDLLQLKELNTHKMQTLGAAIDAPNREEIIAEITTFGVNRCPKFGDMTLYESPWDGFFALDRMVRWVSLHKKA